MDQVQFWALIGMMAAGFGWCLMWLRSIDQRLNNLENRTVVIETILSMQGFPVNPKKVS